MGTNQVLHQLDFNMPQNGENVLLPRPFSATALALAGATRATAFDSLIADGFIFDLANEGIVVPFNVTDDVDLDPGSARLRLEFTAAILSGTSVTMEIANATGIYTTGTTYANSIAAVTTTAGLQTAEDGIAVAGGVITGVVPTKYRFNLDADFQTALAASAAPAGSGIKTIYFELNAAAVAGAGILHMFDVGLRVGSMIVANTRLRRE